MLRRVLFLIFLPFPRFFLKAEVLGVFNKNIFFTLKLSYYEFPQISGDLYGLSYFKQNYY